METLDESVDVPGTGHGEGDRDSLGEYCERRGFVKYRECGTIVAHWKKVLAKCTTLYSKEANLSHQFKVRDEYDKYLHLAKAHFSLRIS